MVWLDGDKFLACGKGTKINQDKNGWITVTIFSGKKKIKISFKKKFEKKFLENRVSNGCTVIIVGGVYNDKLYGWDIRTEGKVSTRKYTLVRGTFGGVSKGKAKIDSGKTKWVQCEFVLESLKNFKVDELHTFLIENYFKSVCEKKDFCIWKSLASCRRCNCLRKEFVKQELAAVS